MSLRWSSAEDKYLIWADTSLQRRLHKPPKKLSVRIISVVILCADSATALPVKKKKRKKKKEHFTMK